MRLLRLIFNTRGLKMPTWLVNTAFIAAATVFAFLSLQSADNHYREQALDEQEARFVFQNPLKVQVVDMTQD